MRPSIRRIGTTPLVMICVLVVLIVTFRTLVSGWGPPAAAPASGSTVFGLAAYPADNLSYISWAEQARGGRWLFEILYTTSDHARLYFNPLFLAIGWIAAILNTSPLLVLNVLSVLSLPVVVLSFWQMCRRVGLGTGASFAATCLALGGAGISWMRWTIGRAGLAGLIPVGPPGPDQSFYDVYPIVAYFVAPYHVLALAIVAALMSAVIALDDPDQRATRGRILLVTGLAFLLATVRPHIAIMTCLAYGATLAASILWRAPAGLIRRRTLLLVCLGIAAVPPVLYSLWISKQPVWIEYAQAYRPETYEWAAGFFFLWGLAGAGLAVLGTRVVQSRFAFPAAWSMGGAILLLGLNGFIYPKLTYGLTLALALLAGVAVDHLLKRVPSRAMRAATIAGVTGLALASPLLLLREFTPRSAERATSGMFRVAETIRATAGAPFPTVLTDCGTGVMLPGLAGARVFCGHWALTDHNREKIVMLSRLGFVADGKAIPTFPDLDEAEVARAASLLREQIRTGTFDYLVVHSTQRLYEVAMTAGASCAVENGREFAVLRLCQPLQARLDQILSTAEME